MYALHSLLPLHLLERPTNPKLPLSIQQYGRQQQIAACASTILDASLPGLSWIADTRSLR